MHDTTKVLNRMKEVLEKEKPESRKNREYDTIVLLEGYGMQFEMFFDSNHPERSVNPKRIGLRHLVLKVDSCEEPGR